MATGNLIVSRFCSFSLQDIATIISAYSRAGPVDSNLLCSMSSAVRLLPVDMIDPQTLALTANAFARARADDPPLFNHLETAALSLDISSFDPSAIAYLLNAFARDSTLVRTRPRPQNFIYSISGSQWTSSERIGSRLSGFDLSKNDSEVGRVKILDVLQAEAVVNLWSSEMDEAGMLAGKKLEDAYGSDPFELGRLENNLSKNQVDELYVQPAVSPTTLSVDFSAKSKMSNVDGSGMSDDELKALADYLVYEPSRAKAGIVASLLWPRQDSVSPRKTETRSICWEC
jgi:hypothetical protein